MSSLLVLQDRDNIIMTSDTASSVLIKGKSYRVSDDEKKIFEINGYTIFASGQKHIRDLFIVMMQDNDIEFTPLYAETSLKKYFLGFDEYCLEVVIGRLNSNSTSLYFLSSYNQFTLSEKHCDINSQDGVMLYTAGIKTHEIASSFEKSFAMSSKVMESILHAYSANQSEEVGGKVEIHRLDSHEKIIEILPSVTLNRIDDIQRDVNLVIGERIIGKLIMGQKLIIEDENGIMRLTGNLQEIFNNLGEVQVALGEYEVGKYGLRVYNGAVDIRTSSLVNRGVVLDANGLRGYNSIGVEKFKIDNDGNAIFSGVLSAATGSFSGDISAASGNFSGTLSGANITGANGTFTGTLSGVSGTFVTLTSGTFSGVTITSASINITDSIRVGNTIWLGENSAGEKSIVFSTNSSIYQPSSTSSLVIESMSNIYLGGSIKFTHYGGTGSAVDFSGASVTGLYPTFG